MCGIFGIASNSQAGYLAYLGLHALQHRGEEAAGIVSADSHICVRRVANGLVGEGITQTALDSLKGDFAIGHVRYSTAGGSIDRNVQPLMTYNTAIGELAIAHNGNIPGFQEWRRHFQKRGALFYSESDTEVLLVAVVQALNRILERSGRLSSVTIASAVSEGLSPIEGSYSLVLLSRRFLIAARDPWGIRPLVLGYLGEDPVIASETTAFDLIGARYERDLNPGEIVVIERGGSLKSFSMKKSSNKKLETRNSQLATFSQGIPCIFEYVYFARPDSHIFGRDIYSVRRAMGLKLAQEAPVPNADCVIAVPDSSSIQALGFAQGLGMPLETGLIRSHYIGRTFIAPQQKIRDFAARLKFNPVRGLLKGKRVVVIDDSIVRGTTSKKIIRLIKEQGGAAEVHLRVASPPVAWPCFYGIDMPRRGELVAAQKSVEEIRNFLDVESLSYLSLEGMLEACGAGGSSFCHACFSGRYQVAKKVIRNTLAAEKIGL